MYNHTGLFSSYNFTIYLSVCPFAHDAEPCFVDKAVGDIEGLKKINQGNNRFFGFAFSMLIIFT